MQKQLKLKIYGRVQGVNFRWDVQKLANELGVAGWVRNAEDGTVEIVAEGTEKVLQKLLDSCYNINKYAKVDNIKVSWQEATGVFSNFNIKY